MKTFCKIFGLAGFVLFFAGCSKNNNDPGVFNCFFLQVGNQWNYDYTEFFSSSTLKQTIESESNGVYRVAQSFNSGVPSYQNWITDGSYLEVYLDGESESDAQKIFKCQASIGDSWHNPSRSVSGGTVYYKVVALNESITTSVGDFICTKIEVTFSYGANIQYNYWSDNYGLVFQDGFVSLDLTSKNF